jgi:hypothetical protein
MAENPALRVRVSLPDGHHTVAAVTAERGGWKVLDTEPNTKSGMPRPRKPRKRAASKPRGNTVAATPTPAEPKE